MTTIFIIDLIKAFIFSFGATAAFSFVFNTEFRDVWWGALFGAIGWVLYVAIMHIGSDAAAYVAGAFAVAICSECAAIIFKRPATVFLVPGILPLVPGGGIYNMMFETVRGNLPEAGSVAYTTLIAAGSIAFGIAIANSISRVILLSIHSRRRHILEEAEKASVFTDAFDN